MPKAVYAKSCLSQDPASTTIRIKSRLALSKKSFENTNSNSSSRNKHCDSSLAPTLQRWEMGILRGALNTKHHSAPTHRPPSTAYTLSNISLFSASCLPSENSTFFANRSHCLHSQCHRVYLFQHLAYGHLENSGSARAD
jgi:hypothetical protein